MTYINPMDCADIIESFATGSELTGNIQAGMAYRRAAQYLRHHCQPINSPEQTVMMLMYRALLIVVMNDGFAELNDDCQKEVQLAIDDFEKYNTVK